MANSYIFTRGGLSVVVNNKPYSAESTHPNYDRIVDALRSRDYEAIPDLINVARAVETYAAEATTAAGDVRVDAEAGLVYYCDVPLHNTVTEQILAMMADNFPIDPLVKFLERLMKNPSNRAVSELYGWMEENGMTIDEEGFILAYKRVRDDYKSFYDGRTANPVGEYVEMPRNMVDDRSDNTCSHGLHFCSQSYLPNYCGGQGRVLLLQIDPADVVSIPTDYNFSKGRACRYFILQELEGDARARIEEEDVLPQPVVMKVAVVNESDDYKDGYVIGYKDGRGKQKRQVFEDDLPDIEDEDDLDDWDLQWDRGYCAGYADGRAKNPKLY